MEFLDINYAEGDSKGKKSENPKEVKLDNVDIVSSVLDRSFELTEQVDLNQFVESLEDSYQKYFRDVMSAKTSGQDKAIVTALLNKYPKLEEDKTQQMEFKSHVENLIAANKLEKGGLKRLFSLLLTGNEDGKITKEPVAQPETEEGQPDAAETEGQEQGQAVETDTENSDLSEEDFYQNWSEAVDDDYTELTEDDFADILDEMPIKSDDTDNILREKSSHPRSTSENIKKARDRAQITEFIKAKKKDMAGNDAYNEEEEYADDEYSIKDKLKNTRVDMLSGLFLGALVGGSISLAKGIKTKLEGKDFRNRIKESEIQLMDTFDAQQLKEYKNIIKLIKRGKYLNTIHSYLDSKKHVFTKDQLKNINEIIVIYAQLRADEKGLGLSNFLSKVASGAGRGMFIGYFADLFGINQAIQNRRYSSKFIAEDFLVDKLYSDYNIDAEMQAGKVNRPYSKEEEELLPAPLATESNIKNFIREKQALQSHKYLRQDQRDRLDLLVRRLKLANKK